MELGIGLPNTVKGVSGQTTLEWARRADEGPFASVGVFDRLVYDSLDPLVTLAAVAGATRRVRLATTVVIGPLRNPVGLAKEAASLDVLSGGRLTLGLALGARRDDYEAAGVPYAERGRRLDAQLRILRDTWEDGRIGPTPLQPNGPELIVGGLDDAAFARAARYADGFVHNGGPPRIFARSVDKALAAWQDAGRPGRPRIWGMAYFALGDDEARAGHDYLLDYYAFTGPFAERIAAGLLTTPQAIIQHIRGYAEAGCDHLVLFPTSSAVDQLERLAQVVGTHESST
ncbi:MAG TPA: LLM class flavin-dependent oxidoreductase [Thermomicrobiales bacterium]|nr:LLM class flavin-dependent oxidoreductase [Thermomicrobiales bacterium]